MYVAICVYGMYVCMYDMLCIWYVCMWYVCMLCVCGVYGVVCMYMYSVHVATVCAYTMHICMYVCVCECIGIYICVCVWLYMYVYWSCTLFLSGSEWFTGSDLILMTLLLSEK